MTTQIRFGFDDNRKPFWRVWVCVYVCCDSQLVNTISQEGKLGQISYLVCRCITMSTRTLLFLVEVNRSNCENLVNMISQEGTLGQVSYLVRRCTTLSAITLLILVNVKRYFG